MKEIIKVGRKDFGYNFIVYIYDLYECNHGHITSANKLDHENSI